MTARRPRCLIIGDYGIILDGLRSILEPHFEIAAVASNVDAALQTAAEFRPDAAIIDLAPNSAALEMGRRLCEAYPALVVTYLADEPAPSWAVNAVSKTCSASALLHAVRHPTAGSELSSSTAGRKSLVRSQGAKLSERERQVLALLLRGHSMKHVARALGITPRTVAFHKYHAMQANGLTNNVELLDFALRHGIVPAADRSPDPASTERAPSRIGPQRLLPGIVALTCGCEIPDAILPFTNALV